MMCAAADEKPGTEPRSISQRLLAGEAQLLTNGREFDRREVYQIRVKGRLEEEWSDWFDGFEIIPQANEETVLTGPVVDQAALHGLLRKICDLGLPLVSLIRLEVEESG
jgi:hypothetical protein